MGEILNKDKLNPYLTNILENFVGNILSIDEDKPNCIMLYGSAVGKNFIAGKSDVNLLLIYDQVNFNLLKVLKRIFKKFIKSLKTNPVVIDINYIKSSADVFPMEFLEWKEKNLIIWGKNPFEELQISNENLRLEIEENLKGKLLRLIQSYFELEDNSIKLRLFLEKTINNFIVVFKNIIRLKSQTPPENELSIIELLSKEIDIELPNSKMIIDMKKNPKLKKSKEEIESIFEGYINEIQKVAEYVDRM